MGLPRPIILLAALCGVSLYLAFAEKLFRSLPWWHVLLIPFGNVWAGVVFFALLVFSVASLMHRRHASTETLGDYVVVGLLIVPWLAYVALGTFMHISGGI